MRVGIPKESVATEHRVALVPETVGRLGEGIEVIVEAGAGAGAGFSDDDYSLPVQTVGDPWQAEVVAKVAAPPTGEVSQLHAGQVLIAFLQPLTDLEGVARSARPGVHGLALEVDPAHDAGAADGCAVVTGDGRGLQGGLLAADRCPASCRC